MPRQSIPNIRSLSGFALFLEVLSVLILLAATAHAQNPVPFTNQPLVPDATAPGGAGFTLTVNGAGFVAASVVNWNGSPRATTFVSKSQLTAIIRASDIATASTAAVTVVSPGPGGRRFQYPVLLRRAARVVRFVPAADDLRHGRDQPLFCRNRRCERGRQSRSRRGESMLQRQQLS
jgi:hypothetical protein